MFLSIEELIERSCEQCLDLYCAIFRIPDPSVQFIRVILRPLEYRLFGLSRQFNPIEVARFHHVVKLNVWQMKKFS
jgi:hypothetical protein